MDKAMKADRTEMAKARSNVYGFLSTAFRAEPSASFLSSLKDPEFSGVLEGLGVSLGEDFNNSANGNLIEDLAVEYTRLFIGPGLRISPLESLHINALNPKDNELYGPQTVKVKKFIEGTGLEYDNNFNELPDHISAELEFMEKICEKEAQAWANEENEFAAKLLEIEKRFYDEHLSQWIPNFCDKVINGAEIPFYKEMANVTKNFLEFENENLPPPAPIP